VTWLAVELKNTVIQTEWDRTQVWISFHWNERSTVVVGPVTTGIWKRRRNHTIAGIANVGVSWEIPLEVAVDLLGRTESAWCASPKRVGRKRSRWCVSWIDVSVRTKHKPCEGSGTRFSDRAIKRGYKHTCTGNSCSHRCRHLRYLDFRGCVGNIVVEGFSVRIIVVLRTIDELGDRLSGSFHRDVRRGLHVS
jgi:hypothetical protein